MCCSPSGPPHPRAQWPSGHASGRVDTQGCAILSLPPVCLGPTLRCDHCESVVGVCVSGGAIFLSTLGLPTQCRCLSPQRTFSFSRGNCLSEALGAAGILVRKHEKFLFVWEFVLGKFVSLVLLMEVYSSARFCEMTS